MKPSVIFDYDKMQHLNTDMVMYSNLLCVVKPSQSFHKFPQFPLHYPLGVFELESISPADLWLTIDSEPKPVNSFDRA